MSATERNSESSSFPAFPRAYASPLNDKENVRRNQNARDVAEKSNEPKSSRALLARGISRNVIRYGETLDSLFCLTDDSHPEHRALSNDIAYGSLANDTASWVRALELASEDVSRDEGTSSRGEDLMRLHRRATSRFSSCSVLKDDHRREVLSMWLSYACAQIKYGSRDEARLTYCNIEKKGLHTGCAAFYAALAEFEILDDAEKAKETLKRGILQNAEPVEDLKRALLALEDHPVSTESRLMKKNATEKARSSTFNSLLPPLPFQKGASRPTKRKAESTYLSPKRSRVEESDSGRHPSPNVVASPLFDAETIYPDRGQVGIEASQRIKPSSSKSSPSSDHDAPSRDGASNKEVHLSSVEDKKGLHETHTTPSSTHRKRPRAIDKVGVATVGRKSSVTPQTLTSAAMRSRHPLFSASKTRLTRLGLGGAQRVSPKNNHLDDSEDSQDENDDHEEVSCKEGGVIDSLTNESLGLSRSKPVPKLTKMDLSYMLNWDPQQTRPSQKDTSHSVSPQTMETPHPQAKILTLPKIDEASASEKSAVSTSTSSLSAPSSQSRSRELPQLTEHTTKQKPTTQDGEINHVAFSTPQSEASHVAKLNPDFLPLVSENNMLRVNNIPYAKLAVIGKGGSCKVYRVLSKELTVLAVKKVKLGGMDKKAINGYANEISLLKRLQGNPYIIQMYDSEVDLSRKAIFVVMEVGEADLSQVLLNHTVTAGKAGSEKRLSLSMNFIRLTWQQMLSAVHSIHEERIIHGDLKPANFLFVRGALKLIDFGIAKAIQSDDTTNIYRDSQIGTLNYMSPEAILDTGAGQDGAQMKVGRASDIWSLGCILYQMVVGRTPFADMHMIQKLQAIVNPDHQIYFPDNVDEAAFDAMKLCLQRDAELRPPIVGKNGLLNEHWFLHSNKRVSK